MKQSKLEEKVEEIFQQQDFSLKKTGNNFLASNDDNEFDIKVYSSEHYTTEEVKNTCDEAEKIFIDEDLRGVKEEVPVDVSVLKEKENSSDVKVPSYERIGDIVVISELSEDISKQEAVEGILEHNPNLDSIILKTGKLSGEFRVGNYEMLYGEGTETVHKEHGTQIKVDPTEMFFSEREGTERKRIFESVQEGEKVLVMFCGVGPFPVTIARNARPEKVVGIEKNPKAVNYARENIELNNVSDEVEILQGDVKNVCPNLGCFERVLMPSPTNSLEFVEEAIDCTCENGVLVVYSIQHKDNMYEEVIEVVEQVAENMDRNVRVSEKRVVSDFSPAKRKVAVEFEIE